MSIDCRRRIGFAYSDYCQNSSMACSEPLVRDCWAAIALQLDDARNGQRQRDVVEGRGFHEARGGGTAVAAAWIMFLVVRREERKLDDDDGNSSARRPHFLYWPGSTRRSHLWRALMEARRQAS